MNCLQIISQTQFHEPRSYPLYTQQASNNLWIILALYTNFSSIYGTIHRHLTVVIVKKYNYVDKSSKVLIHLGSFTRIILKFLVSNLETEKSYPLIVIKLWIIVHRCDFLKLYLVSFVYNLKITRKWS